MKKIKIGKIDGFLIDSANDIWDSRYTKFRQYLFRSMENFDEPSFEQTYNRCMELFNSQKYSQAIIELRDYHSKSVNVFSDYDQIVMCFALLFLYENEKENQADVDEGTLKRKIDELRDNGLTRGFAEESVLNFIQASLTISEAWKMEFLMKLPLKD